MNLKRAHEEVGKIKGGIGYGSIGEAAIILDYRVEELEGELQQLQKEVGLAPIKNYISDLQKAEEQRDKLLKVAIKFCKWWYTNKYIHAVPIPIHNAIFDAVSEVTGKTWKKIYEEEKENET